MKERLERLQKICLGIGLLSLAVSGLGAMGNGTAFAEAYLVGYLAWLGVGLGSLVILMLHHVAGGRWGYVVRRVLEAGAGTLPVMAILFLPILPGMKHLYVWTHPDVVAADANLQHKQLYLNPTFFLVRAAVYFALWILIVKRLDRAARRQDEAPSLATTKRLTIISAAGLGTYCLTMTLAAIDWAMSLEPHWYSTMYGVLIMTGQVLAGFAFVILVASRLADRPPYAEAIQKQDFHDLGNFLMTFVVFWAYIAFSQFLIIWMGNLVDENGWYLRRMEAGWRWVLIGLVALHFFIPFFLLLSRDIKRRRGWLAKVAGLVFVTGFLDLYWIVAPSYRRPGMTVHWLDIVVPVGIGGVWLAVFLQRLKNNLTLPVHDSRVEEELQWA